MDTVYIETSIVSHATARPSSDPATAVLQDQAKRWMNEQAAKYELGLPGLLIATPCEFLGGDSDDKPDS